MGKKEREAEVAEEAMKFYDQAWYRALDRLVGIVETGEDGPAVQAAGVIMDYSRHFTVLGAPYIPITDPPDTLINFEEEDD